MKAFDRACIIILGWLGTLMFCAIPANKTALIVAIATTVVAFVLIVYENRICYYEERADYYKKLFLKQNKEYFDMVMKEKVEEKESEKHIILEPYYRARQKSGIDKTKAS